MKHLYFLLMNKVWRPICTVTLTDTC